MNRQQKETVVSNLKEMFNKANASFLVQYKGLSVSALQQLRQRLRLEKGVFKVTKARLMKIASGENSSIEDFRIHFKNQVALVFAMDDVPSVAKKIVEFSKEHETLQIVSGYFESALMTKEQIAFLASIPSRDVLLAQLVGVLQAPMAQLAVTLKIMSEHMPHLQQQAAQDKEVLAGADQQESSGGD